MLDEKAQWKSSMKMCDENGWWKCLMKCLMKMFAEMFDENVEWKSSMKKLDENGQWMLYENGQWMLDENTQWKCYRVSQPNLALRKSLKIDLTLLIYALLIEFFSFQEGSSAVCEAARLRGNNQSPILLCRLRTTFSLTTYKRSFQLSWAIQSFVRVHSV